MTLASTHASSHITPRSGAAAARHCHWPFCLCLLWSLDPFGLFLIFAKFAKTRIIELPCDLPRDGEYDEEMTARIIGRNEDD